MVKRLFGLAVLSLLFLGLMAAEPEGDGFTQLPSSPFTLLTVCRVVAVKSLATQIRALKTLHDRGQDDVGLVIVGDGPARMGKALG